MKRLEKRPNGFLKNKSDEELVALVASGYQGETITELQKNDCGLYQIVLERGLIDKLVSSGVLVRERQTISEKTRQDIISLVEKTGFSYNKIADRFVVSASSIGHITKEAIGEGKLDSGYKRPCGVLYLFNVRKEHTRTLENILL